MPKKHVWVCAVCLHPDCEGTHFAGAGTVPEYPHTEGTYDLIADPEPYWKRVREEMATWQKVEEDDGPDVPTFL